MQYILCSLKACGWKMGVKIQLRSKEIKVWFCHGQRGYLCVLNVLFYAWGNQGCGSRSRSCSRDIYFWKDKDSERNVTGTETALTVTNQGDGNGFGRAVDGFGNEDHMQICGYLSMVCLVIYLWNYLRLSCRKAPQAKRFPRSKKAFSKKTMVIIQTAASVKADQLPMFPGNSNANSFTYQTAVIIIITN
jgi:hypothetical protein